MKKNSATIYQLSTSPTVEQRLWAKVNKNGPIPENRPDLGPCWLWTGGLTGDGYGQIWVDGQRCYVHRVSYELLVGPIPHGLESDHLCRVRNCVNHAHIEPVTKAENLRRGLPGRRIYNGAHERAKTHCPQGHPYAGENLYVTSAGKRMCWTCIKARNTQHATRVR